MKISTEAQRLHDFLPPVCWMTKETLARGIGCRTHKIKSLKEELEAARLIVIRYHRNGNRQNPRHEIIKTSGRGTPICKHIKSSYALNQWGNLDRNALIECCLRSNWDVAPFLERGKKPIDGLSLAVWREWSVEARMDFFFNNPKLNVGLAVCSHMMVVDVDAKSNSWIDHNDFQNTLTVATPRGYHFYFRKDPVVTTGAKLLPDVDTRCAGSFVVLPPSIHESGKPYVWENICPPKSLPLQFRSEWRQQDFLTNRRAGKFILPAVIPDGTRNDTLWRFGRSLRAQGKSFHEIEAALIEINRSCAPPIPVWQMNLLIKNICNRADKL